MATRDIIFAAAGTAGEATYVEDVFSTYLYTGNSSTQTITNGIQLGDSSVIASQSSTALPTSTNRNYQFVAGGNGIYVAQAYLSGSPFASNYYATSTDGVTWTNQTSLPASYLWYGLAFGNGVFVMTTQYDASAEKAIYSSDGLNWSTASGYPSNYLSAGVNFVNGEFFSINNDVTNFGQTIYRSSNGASWSSVSVNAGSSTQYRKIAYGAGIYILTGNSNTVYSSNLSSWSINSVGILSEIAYGNNKFIARTQINALVTSTDGINWTTVQASGFFIGSITFNGSLFLGSDSSGKIYWSSDGINWTSNSTVSTTSLVNTTLSGKTVFIGTGNGARSAVVVDSFTPATLGKGGLVWQKVRGTAGYDHVLTDTATSGTGASTKFLSSNTTNGFSSNVGNIIGSYNGDGFTLNSGSGFNNVNGVTACSWTFRKQPKFFDVVTWTGNDSTAQTISHNLGSTPGFIIAKATSTTGAWWCYHRGLTDANQKALRLQLTNTPVNIGVDIWNPTSTTFQADSNLGLCYAGVTYVAYLFAHNAGGFGASGNENVISCGSFTTNGSGSATVSLGYEPQWVMIKRTDSTSGWIMFDVMRGMSLTNSFTFQANTSGAEVDNGASVLQPTATGFFVPNSQLPASSTWIYMAIRRGPMKTPTSGTSVFSPIRETSSASTQILTTGFPVDLTINTLTNGQPKVVMDRLRGGSTTFYNYLNTTSTAAEATGTSIGVGFDNNTAIVDNNWWINPLSIYWNFGRAPGFFDVVCYTGTGTNRTVTHNLGAVPELMIVKIRSGTTGSWFVYTAATGNTNRLLLNDTVASGTSGVWNNTSPTATEFTVGVANAVNGSGYTYAAYLFATVSGVSKVGSYTGTGSAQTINCGFTGGARFVMIKSINNASDWWVWDTARGMVSGTDPSLAFNTTDPEYNFNSVYTATTGFQLLASPAQSVNNSGETYIFLAIA